MEEAQQLKAIKAYIAAHTGPVQRQDYPLVALIGFALLGGMILNIMPCVLPVIPLKVLGLVQQAHGDRRLSLLHGLVFSAGIISLFVALAVLLKAAGLFYGQQFQSTAFLVAMAMVVLALALSMLGVWTISPPQVVYAVDRPRAGFAGSYMNGLLATLLATPCSAPYLGPVLAWALVQPMWVTILGLGLVGVGMSVPYLVLAAFPAGLDRLPHAGRWAELLKQGLGLVMVGVAIYLITRITNVTLWPWVLYGAVALAAVCWIWGQIPTPAMEPGKVWAIRGAAVVFGLGMGLGLYAWARASAVEARTPGQQVVRLPAQPDGQEWLPFNWALVEEGLRQRRPVVIDWTANWCINCRVVEATVLDTAAMRQVFARHNAVLLRADLSGPNPPAELLLNEHFRSYSIPVLAVMSANGADRALRDVYTVQAVSQALEGPAR